MNKWSIGRKVLLICLGLGLLNVLQGSLSLVNFYRSRDTVKALNSDTFTALYWASKLKGVAKDQRIAIVFYIYATKPEDQIKWSAQVEKTEAELQQVRNNYPKFDPLDADAIKDSAAAQAKFYQAWLKIRELGRQGNSAGAWQVYNTDLTDATLARRNIEDYLAFVDSERGNRLSQNALNAVSVGIPAVWTLLLLTVGLSISVSFWFAYSVQKSSRQLEEETIRSTELAHQAEQASIAKSEFLANMSHELRTPMNGVIGMTGLLLDTQLTAEQRHFAETVRSSGESLLTVISDILDLSKIEANKLELDIDEFDLISMLDNLAATVAAQANARNFELLASADANVPVRLKGDCGRLRQILTNLAGNAVKFTQRGEVELRVSVLEEGEDNCLLRFSVRDTGIGIPPDKIGLLFQKFSQVEASTTRKFGGTGLGLAISKQLAELMGGNVGVTSDAGRGSEFWFTARLGKVTQPALTDTETQTLSALIGLRILLVDDNASSCALLSRMTTAWQMRPTSVEGAPWALDELARAHAAGDPYRIVLIDLKMPVMNGEALGQSIRENPLYNETQLILLVPLGVPITLGYYEAIGFNGCITKPVRRASLLDTLSGVLSGRSAAEMVRIAERDAQRDRLEKFDNNNLRILLAEDNLTNQKVALSILHKLGLKAEAVANGAEALWALENTPYDLVLMDVRMPVMDGIEATRRIRDPKSSVLLHNIPIIAMTANAMDSDRDACRQAGMNGFVSKPVSPAKLREELEKWIRPSQPHPSPEPVGAAVSVAKVTVEELPVFARDTVIERMMGDEELAQAIMEAFLDDMPEQIQTLRASLASGDAAVSGRQAHSIKGASANVGGERLRKVALEMEKAADSGDLASAVSRMEELQQQYLVLETAIRTSWKA